MILVSKNFRRASGILARFVLVQVVNRDTPDVVAQGTTDGVGFWSVYLNPGQYDWLVDGQRIPFDVVAPAGGAARYSHQQVGASASWPITHNLNAYPDPVVLLDSDPDTPVLTDVEYTSPNQLIILFPQPVSGWAHL